jgi:hypothetical protein
MGNRKKAAERKSVHVNVLCTVKERVEWKRRAKEQGRSVGGWFRHLASCTDEKGQLNSEVKSNVWS